MPEETSAKQPEHVVMDTIHTGYDGYGLAQKLVFFGIILGCLAMYFRMRSRNVPIDEKYSA